MIVKSEIWGQDKNFAYVILAALNAHRAKFVPVPIFRDLSKVRFYSIKRIIMWFVNEN